MSSEFRRTRDGSIRVSFEAVEAGVLQHLIGQLAEMLSDRGDRDPLVDWPQPGQPPRSADPLTRHDPVADLAAAVGLSSEPVSTPTDPVLARLLPDGYRDDPEAAADFRRYTEYDLRMGKLSATAIVLDTLDGIGGPLSLDEAQAHEWLRVLNDLRLAIGTRLDVEEDYQVAAATLAEDDPRLPMYEVYEWLTWLQESLVQALGPD